MVPLRALGGGGQRLLHRNRAVSASLAGLKNSQQCNNVLEPILNLYYLDWIRVDGISFAGTDNGGASYVQIAQELGLP